MGAPCPYITLDLTVKLNATLFEINVIANCCNPCLGVKSNGWGAFGPSKTFDVESLHMGASWPSKVHGIERRD